MNHLILAQADLTALKAEFIKSMVIFSVGTIVVMSFVAVAVFAWLQYRLDKRSKKEVTRTEVHPQPLEISKAPKRFNAALAREQHEELKERVDGHDQEIKELRTDLNDLSAEIRDKLSDMPGKIVVDILNAQKLGRKND